MASPRTVSVTLMLVADPDPLPDGEGRLGCSLEDVVQAYPWAAAALLGLRDGGWRFDAALREHCRAVTAIGGPSLGTCADFKKDFVSATPLDASDDARTCGVSDDLSPVFDWTADSGEDDDGAWDLWQGEL